MIEIGPVAWISCTTIQTMCSIVIHNDVHMRIMMFPVFAVIFDTTFYQLDASSVKRVNSLVGLF